MHVTTTGVNLKEIRYEHLEAHFSTKKTIEEHNPRTPEQVPYVTFFFFKDIF